MSTWASIVLPIVASCVAGAVSAFVILRTQVAVIDARVEDHARRIASIEAQYNEVIRLLTRLETLLEERQK